mgnify:FL=1
MFDHENDPNEWDNLAEQQQFIQIKSELKKYLPATEAPLVLQGKALHNIIDADQPSFENFKKMWDKMQERGMGLE